MKYKNDNEKKITIYSKRKIHEKGDKSNNSLNIYQKSSNPYKTSVYCRI